MRVWAIADLHLAFGVDKPMDIFGEHWLNHFEKIASHWDSVLQPDDLVLLPGDLSWATKPHELAPDMDWLAQRPGLKVLSKGNHDYWWPKSQKKLNECLPDQTWAIKKKAVQITTPNGPLGIIAVRGGDFAPLTKYGDERSQEAIDITLAKELKELEASLTHLEELERANQPSAKRVCLFHYPPFPAGQTTSLFSDILAKSESTLCLYGHLHGPHVGEAKIEGEIEDMHLRCVSCDQVDFKLTDVTDLIWSQ